MLSSNASHKDKFLAEAKAAREERQMEATKRMSAVRIQSSVRGWLARLRVRRQVLHQFDQVFPALEENQEAKPGGCVESYKAARMFLYFVGRKDGARLETLIRYIVASLASESPRTSYVGVFLNKKYSVSWIEHIKQLCTDVLAVLSLLSPEKPKFSKKSAVLVLALISFTSTSTWSVLTSPSLSSLAPHMANITATVTGHLVQAGMMKTLNQLLLSGLASPGAVSLSRTTLSAVLSLAARPVVYTQYSQQMVSLYTLHILSVPGLLQYSESLCGPSGLLGDGRQAETLLLETVKLLSQDQQLRIHFNALEGSYALCLTANLVHLVSGLERLEPAQLVSLVTTLTQLLSSLGQYVTARQSQLSHWHPVLGWFSVSLDKHLQASLSLVRTQLARLWSPECLMVISSDLHSLAASLPPVSPPQVVHSPLESGKMFGVKMMRQAVAALEKTKTTVAATTSNMTAPANKLGNPATTRVALVCALYQTACQTLSQLRIDILNGLCYGDLLLKPLWIFLNSLGQNCGHNVTQ